LAQNEVLGIGERGGKGKREGSGGGKGSGEKEEIIYAMRRKPGRERGKGQEGVTKGETGGRNTSINETW